MKRWIPVCLVLAGLMGCGRSHSDPETEIRELIKAAEQAAQEHDIDWFEQHLAPGYSDHRGNDRDTFLKRLRLLFLRYPEPHLLTRVHDIRFPSPVAAEVTLWLGSADTSKLALDSHRLELSLRLMDDEWRAVRAQWQRGTPFPVDPGLTSGQYSPDMKPPRILNPRAQRKDAGRPSAVTRACSITPDARLREDAV